MIEPAKLRADVVAILAAHTHGRFAAASIADETPLFDGGLDLDSLALLEIVGAVEDATGIVLGETDLDQAALRTVGSFVSLIARLSGGR